MTDPVPHEPGAPIARDAIDPELIRLSRSRPKLGLITAAGLVFLCGYFLLRLNADRQFAGQDPTPARTTVADVLANKVAIDRFVALEGAEPVLATAIRTATSPGSLGLRAVAVRGTQEQLWLAMPGDGWSRPALGPYLGRLRRLADLPFAPSLVSYVSHHPRLSFATVPAIRAGFTAGTVRGATGDSIAVADSDRVTFEVVDAKTAQIVGVLSDRLPTASAWAGALTRAGITTVGEPQSGDGAVRFTVKLDGNDGEIAPNQGPAGSGPSTPTDTVRSAIEVKLEAAKLWAARVEPVTHHVDTTWGALKTSPANGLRVDGKVITDDQIDLIGIYVARSIPPDAYAVIVGERPEDYWYIQPIIIGLGLMGALFVFALYRAIRRDLLPARP